MAAANPNELDNVIEEVAAQEHVGQRTFEEMEPSIKVANHLTNHSRQFATLQSEKTNQEERIMLDSRREGTGEEQQMQTTSEENKCQAKHMAELKEELSITKTNCAENAKKFHELDKQMAELKQILSAQTNTIAILTQTRSDQADMRAEHKQSHHPNLQVAVQPSNDEARDFHRLQPDSDEEGQPLRSVGREDDCPVDDSSSSSSDD